MTPTIHKIADTKPVFPCWILVSPWTFWSLCNDEPAYRAWCRVYVFTHWCHSETRPTVTPDAEPTLTVGFGLDGRPLASAHMPQAVFGELIDHRPIAHTVATDSANPSPRPACDCVEKVADEIVQDLFTSGSGERATRLVMEHSGRVGLYGWCEKAVMGRVAAILRKHFGSQADELRRRDEEIARLTLRAADRDEWQEVALNNQARAEKAEAELRAVAGELRGIASGVFTEAVRAAREIANERDTLRAEVAALKAERDSITDRCLEINAALNDAITKIGQIPSSDIGTDHPLAQLQQMLHRVLYKENAADKIVADLRAQLAAAHTIIARWKEFIEECETAEDRSNLDGDSADAVLQQLNDGAEEMLKLTPENVADQLAASEQRLKEAEASADAFMRGPDGWLYEGFNGRRSKFYPSLSAAIEAAVAARAMQEGGGK